MHENLNKNGNPVPHRLIWLPPAGAERPPVCVTQFVVRTPNMPRPCRASAHREARGAEGAQQLEKPWVRRGDRSAQLRRQRLRPAGSECGRDTAVLNLRHPTPCIRAIQMTRQQSRRMENTWTSHALGDEHRPRKHARAPAAASNCRSQERAGSGPRQPSAGAPSCPGRRTAAVGNIRLKQRLRGKPPVMHAPTRAHAKLDARPRRINQTCTACACTHHTRGRAGAASSCQGPPCPAPSRQTGHALTRRRPRRQPTRPRCGHPRTHLSVSHGQPQIQ
jgi:hypothetical protein